VAQERMRARELITHRFELADYARALATFADQGSGAIKVVLTP
jgi:threonine dehydrogenase-like Zn-dependent dehydrogenase